MGIFQKDDSKVSEPRKEAKDITFGKTKPHFIGPKSKEVKKQELISHIQNYQETFNSAELNVWQNKLGQLTQALYHSD